MSSSSTSTIRRPKSFRSHTTTHACTRMCAPFRACSSNVLAAPGWVRPPLTNVRRLRRCGCQACRVRTWRRFCSAPGWRRAEAISSRASTFGGMRASWIPHRNGRSRRGRCSFRHSAGGCDADRRLDDPVLASLESLSPSWSALARIRQAPTGSVRMIDPVRTKRRSTMAALGVCRALLQADGLLDAVPALASLTRWTLGCISSLSAQPPSEASDRLAPTCTGRWRGAVDRRNRRPSYRPQPGAKEVGDQPGQRVSGRAHRQGRPPAEHRCRPTAALRCRSQI